jgi:hypothetical protein
MDQGKRVNRIGRNLPTDFSRFSSLEWVSTDGVREAPLSLIVELLIRLL